MQTKYNKYGVNNHNEYMFLYKEETCLLDEYMKAIRIFTSNNERVKQLYIMKGIKQVKEKDGKYLLQDEKNSIEYYQLSDWLSSITIKNPSALDQIKQELLDEEKRNRQCHNKSIYLFQTLGDTLVTGYINSATKDIRILHTWIEKDSYVIDYTSNLIINKNMYYNALC